jgi:hypothetical protein
VLTSAHHRNTTRVGQEEDCDNEEGREEEDEEADNREENCE